MHNNFYFLRKLCAVLIEKIDGTVVSECFSQHKDELVIRFETHSKPFFIKASLEASFTCLSFPNEFNRARKNSIDLFPLLIGRRVTGVHQFENERSFALNLSDDFLLLFKMHGNRSNVILFQGQNNVDRFKKNMLQDVDLTLDHLAKSIDWSWEAFMRYEKEPAKLYFTFGKPVWEYLHSRGFNDRSAHEKWETILEVKQMLEDPQFYIVEKEAFVEFTLLPSPSFISSFRDPIQAVSEFYYAYVNRYSFAHDKQHLLQDLRHKLESSERYYDKNFAKLMEVETDDHYKVWADLLMANLHSVKAGMEKIQLQDFYHENELIEIKLKKDISPQKNAEIFYRKSKNQNIEIQRLRQTLEDKQKEIEQLKKDISVVEQTSDPKSLKRSLSSVHSASEKQRSTESLPFHEFEFQGFKIWVGKNAQANDVLTLKYGFKEDLWLHAKDVTGSHVLIKYQSGKVIPKDVIERAAQLAAYNSKRKHETLCPVVVTPRKFVRKRKGDPAGLVVVEREEVIMVEPKL